MKDLSKLNVVLAHDWLMNADPMVHACALAYMSDMGSGFSGIGDGHIPPGGPSLDHAAWFHQRVRADEWCWNDLHPIVNANARPPHR